jgi:hypothetical protein
LLSTDVGGQNELGAFLMRFSIRALAFFITACLAGAAGAQPVPPDYVPITKGTRIWVALTVSDQWQKGVVEEETLHENSYIVRTDQYRNEQPRTVRVQWQRVERLKDDCTPPSQGSARVGSIPESCSAKK